MSLSLQLYQQLEFFDSQGNASLEEMLSKLPKFEKPVLSTFSPYDINRLSNDMIHEEEEAARAAQMKSVDSGFLI